jgi:hypothetical protein
MHRYLHLLSALKFSNYMYFRQNICMVQMPMSILIEMTNKMQLCRTVYYSIVP